MKKTFYVTTPIYYPSGNLHIGHLYTTTLARILANYKQLQGFDVKLLTGADEHGQKIQLNAEKAGLDPQTYVDQMSIKFKNLWTKAQIKYDYYSRTSEQKHMDAVTKQFSQLFKQGDIFKGKYKGLYSISDEEFLTSTQAIKKDGKFYHPQSGHELEEIFEESYFFKMSKYESWWKEYIKENPHFIIPNKIINELKSNFVDKGLIDLSVTRSTFDWGIPITEDDKHIVYVWLDALNNYITALGYNQKDDSDFQKYWKNGTEIVHIVGKEITRFHGIYWPIILKAIGLRIPTTILSHGWIVTSEGKMSKSKGNIIDPIHLIDTYGPEVVKYYFASQINIGQDGTFDESILKNVYNSELANNYGNLLSRTTAMFCQNFDVPVKHFNPKENVDIEILNEIKISSEKYIKYFDEYQINKGLQQAIQLGKKLNGYIDITKPWILKEDKKRLAEILNILLNGIYAVSTMLTPAIPNKASEALKLLGFDKANFTLILDFGKFDNIIPVQGKVLFERIK